MHCALPTSRKVEVYWLRRVAMITFTQRAARGESWYARLWPQTQHRVSPQKPTHGFAPASGRNTSVRCRI